MTNVVVSPSTIEKEILTDTTAVEYLVSVNPSIQEHSVTVNVIDNTVDVIVNLQLPISTVELEIVNNESTVLVQPVDQTKTVSVVINEETSESVEDPDLSANKTFVYTSGNLTRLQYSTGSYKDFFYDISGRLSYVDYVKNTSITRKTINYNLDGTVSTVITTIV